MQTISRLLPKKGNYRMRAHINPLKITQFPFPPHHTYVDWKKHYPLYFGGTVQDNHTSYCNTDEHPSLYQFSRQYQIKGKQVSILDIGCGYGGLLFALAPMFPNKLILGLQIRDKIVNYASEKIRGYRIKYPDQYDNISVVRTNSMKHLCQYFPKQSIDKIFICFPDPHFKAKQFNRRIINTGYLSQYAYLLKPLGRIYCITDVFQLHQWHLEHLHNHQMFQQINDKSDPCVEAMINKTEEGLKVQRHDGMKYWSVFQKKELPIDQQIKSQ